MTFGNLASRPDLRPLFGELAPDRNTSLLDRVQCVDARLVALARQASAHVGVQYNPLGLGLVIREDGSSAGVHGGASGDAGDLWFDISHASRASRPGPWHVESAFYVFCCDYPERGGSNNHPLALFRSFADTPEAVLDALEAHVSGMEAALTRYSRETILQTPHALLPDSR